MNMGSPQADELCPNCCSPFKCNGPHVGEAPEHGYENLQPTQSSESAPKWSPTPPTKDGWYWLKFGNDDASVVFVASGDELSPHYPLGGYLWCGPLQEPTND